MKIHEIRGVRIAGIHACLPATSVDNLAACTTLFHSPERAQAIVRATGIHHRRIAASGVTALDLCIQSAERLLNAKALQCDETCDAIKASLGGIVSVSFTSPCNMPANACQAQNRLGLSHDLAALDLNMACSGYVYGLYVAAGLVRTTGQRVLLLDGDVQSSLTRPDDEATLPVLADAGTATLLEPDAAAQPWQMAFLTHGEGGAALTLPFGGTIAMDGFGVYKFVAGEARKFLSTFMTQTTCSVPDAFVPHQANIYMIHQLADALKIPRERLWLSGDALGNSASASVPVTLAWCGQHLSKVSRRVLLAGFGGGLSASAAYVPLEANTWLSAEDFTG